MQQQLSLFDALPAAPAPSLDDLFAGVGGHDWNRVGAARTKGGTTFHTFRFAATDDERELAEGELPYWLVELDQAAGVWAKRARADIGAIEVVVSRQGLENRVKAVREQLRRITDVALRRKVHEELVRAEALADERLVRLERRAAEQEREARAAKKPAPARGWS